MVTERPSEDSIIGRSFLNRQVTDIRCADLNVQLSTEVIPIVQKDNALTNQGNPPSEWTDQKATKLEAKGRKTTEEQKEEVREHAKLTRVILEK